MGKRRGKGEGQIEQLNSGRWRARLPGRNSAGRSATFSTRQAAQDWLRANAGLPANPVGTLAEWLDRWESLHRAETETATWRKDEHTVKRHVRPRLGPVKMRDLTALRVRTFFAGLAGDGVTPGERFKAGKVLRACLNSAVANGLLPANPIDGRRLKIPPKPRPETTAYTPGEVVAILKAADALGHGALFRLWIDTGLRPGELLALAWDDFDGRSVGVRRSLCVMTRTTKDLKTKWSRRTIRLSGETVAALAGHPRRGDVLFPAARGGHWWARNFKAKVIDRVLAKAGVKGNAYRFRHTTATLLLRAGVSLAAVAARLGHRDPSTTLKHYAHVLSGDQEQAAAVIGGFLRVPESPSGAPSPQLPTI